MGCTHPERSVYKQVWGETVLCVVIATQARVVVTINERYPHALAHAEGHLAAGGQPVWICGPECPGA